MMRRQMAGLVGAVAAALLAGCTPDYSPNTYTPAAVQQANKVERGIIIGVRPIDVTAAGVVGAATGAAAGGVAGAQAPGGSMGSAFGAIGGSLLGGLVGTSVEHATGDTHAFEYIVRKLDTDKPGGGSNKDWGELVSVTQKDVQPLAIGTKVLVIAGNQARIVPDYTTDPAPSPAPESAAAPPTSATAPTPPPVTTAPLAPPGDAPAAPATAPASAPAPATVTPPKPPAE